MTDEPDDAQLINDIMLGDDAAFNMLVRKYQKTIHALVWRKISDFHYAEEVTKTPSSEHTNTSQN